MSHSLRFGYTSSRDLLEKLGRARLALRAAINAQDDAAVKDTIFDFCVTAHSLKDWIKEEKPGLKSDIESAIDGSRYLGTCADIANSAKHKEITKFIRQKDAISIDRSELTCDMTTIDWSSTIPFNGYTVRIEYADGTRVEILHLAERVLGEWAAFMNRHGL